MADALKKFSYVVLAVILILAVIFFVKILFFSGKISTDDAQIDSHLVSVSCRVSGTVLKVLVNDNQAVKAGQPLVQLDPKDYKAEAAEASAALLLAEKNYAAARLSVPVAHYSTAGAISQSQAGLLASQADVQTARERIAQLRAAITQSRADLAAARSRLSLSEANYRRARLLARNYVASQQQFDAYKTAYENDLASVQASQAMLKQSLLQLAQSRSQLAAEQAAVAEARGRVMASQGGPQQVRAMRAQAAAARAGLLQARARLRLALLQLSYTTVYASENGIVSNDNVTSGEVISPGQQLMILAPDGDIWVTANFKETELGNMKPGDKAEITVDAFPGKSFSGTVNSLGGATGSATSLFPPENATGNFVKVVQRLPVKIVFNPGQDISGLRTGMSVEATVYFKK